MNRPRAPHAGLSAEVFARIVEGIPMQAAAVRYGLNPDAHGFCCCPLHGEKTPSFKIYPGRGGFYCFGCGVGGDVVTFAERLFGLKPLDAAKRLDADFSLGLFTQAPPPQNDAVTRKRALEDAARRAEEQRRDALYTELRGLYHRPMPAPLDDAAAQIYAAGQALAEYYEYCLNGF